jgi:hypothetical protein
MTIEKMAVSKTGEKIKRNRRLKIPGNVFCPALGLFCIFHLDPGFRPPFPDSQAGGLSPDCQEGEGKRRVAADPSGVGIEMQFTPSRAILQRLCSLPLRGW